MQSFMKKVKETAVATPSFLMFYELDTPGRVEFSAQPWSRFAANYRTEEVSHGSTTRMV
jgi:hypothetical protein